MKKLVLVIVFMFGVVCSSFSASKILIDNTRGRAVRQNDSSISAIEIIEWNNGIFTVYLTHGEKIVVNGAGVDTDIFHHNVTNVTPTEVKYYIEREANFKVSESSGAVRSLTYLYNWYLTFVSHSADIMGKLFKSYKLNREIIDIELEKASSHYGKYPLPSTQRTYHKEEQEEISMYWYLRDVIERFNDQILRDAKKQALKVDTEKIKGR
jgi:hypothetical protein